MLPTNTHILFHEFDYLAPASITEVTELLAAHGDGARVMAGGTDLLVQMKMERQHPQTVVSLRRVAALNHITPNGGLTLGATTPIRLLYQALVSSGQYAALAEACNWFSTVQIMNMATVGGNLCNASPAADSAPSLLVHSAAVSLQSREGERTLPLDSFFLGPGRTALRPGELLTAVHLPPSAPNTGSAFIKLARVVADISQVCAAVQLTREDNLIRAARIAFGSVAPTPVRAVRAEAALVGQPFSLELAEHAASLAAQEISPITDVRATREYRQRAAAVIVRDSILKAWERTH